MIFIDKKVPGSKSEASPHGRRINECIPIAAESTNRKLSAMGYTSKKQIPRAVVQQVFQREMNRETYRRGLRVLSRAEIRELI